MPGRGRRPCGRCRRRAAAPCTSRRPARCRRPRRRRRPGPCSPWRPGTSSPTPADEDADGPGDEEGGHQAEQHVLARVPLHQGEGLVHGAIEARPADRQEVRSKEARDHQSDRFPFLAPGQAVTSRVRWSVAPTSAARSRCSRRSSSRRAASGIEDLVGALLAAKQAGLVQDREMLGDGRDVGADQFLQVPDAVLGV